MEMPGLVEFAERLGYGSLDGSGGETYTHGDP